MQKGIAFLSSSFCLLYSAFPKNGNSRLISSGEGREPYSHSSNVSANLTALPRSSPYSLVSTSRERLASPDCRSDQRALSQAFRAVGSASGGTLRSSSSLPLAPPS